jgi:hypothetical protein
MSFAKIAEARAVKKIVILLRQRAESVRGEETWRADELLEAAAKDVEAGNWKDIKLPPPKPKKKKK